MCGDVVYIDFETYSEADIKKCGAWRYSIDQTTEILCMAFAINDEPVELWTPQNNCNLEKLFIAIECGSLVEAHNAFFERCIWQNVAETKLRFPHIPKLQWRCSAARVATLALPRSLEEAAKILECKNQKDTEGGKLMLKLCKPKRETKKDPTTRYTPDTAPEMFEAMYEYCKQDVETERDISKLTRPLIEFEQQVWHLDQEINERGVYIDKEAVEQAYIIGIEYIKDSLERISKLTEGAVNSFRQIKACQTWAKEVHGYELEKMDKGYIETILQEDNNIPAPVKEMLQIRRDGAKTSTAKYEAILNCIAPDNRVRDNYMYHGASTGRWSGKNVQFQNLPRGKIKDMDVAVEIIKSKDAYNLIPMCYNLGTMEFLSSAIRGMIMAPEGKQLYVADYAGIEARGVAWIAGQEDLLDDFRSGAKIYEKQAAFTYNKPVEEIGKDSVERFVGKQQVLACGYGMGAKKFRATCALFGIELDEAFCDVAVKAYRKKNSLIVNQWYAQERAAILAVQTGKPILEGKVTWFMHEKFLYCKLPSGRCLAYFKPCIKEGETSWGETRMQLHITNQKIIDTKKVWCEYGIYGGLIVENIVQAICRDLVAYGMLKVKEAGYDVIMHSHDELISEAPIGFGSVEEYERLMCSLPSWAECFPVKAEGWCGKRYKK